MSFTQATLIAFFGYVISTGYGTGSAEIGSNRGYSDRRKDYRIDDTSATSDAGIYGAESREFDAAQKLFTGRSQASNVGKPEDSKRFGSTAGGFKVREAIKSKPFKFEYIATNGIGSNHRRTEQRDEHGNVHGTYGYTNIQGFYRIVEYVADANGFRANIHSNEPGVGRRNPADVVVTVENKRTVGVVRHGPFKSSPVPKPQIITSFNLPRSYEPLRAPVPQAPRPPVRQEPLPQYVRDIEPPRYGAPQSGYVRDKVNKPRMFASDGVNTVECNITPKLKALQLLAEKLCKI